MNLRDCIQVCITWLKRMEKQDPDGSIKSDTGRISYRLARSELEKTLAWVYPKLSTKDIRQVITCRKCKYYKKYRKKNSKQVSYRCSLTMERHNEDYFCADGQEKEEV